MTDHTDPTRAAFEQRLKRDMDYVNRTLPGVDLATRRRGLAQTRAARDRLHGGRIENIT